MDLPVVVELIDPRSTLALRRRVLRPHQTIAEMAASTDRVPELFAVAAIVAEHVVSCAVAHPEPLPDSEMSVETPWWRVRGMATEPERRDDGLGSQVLDRLLEEIGRRGGRRIWCNARVPARTLYERAGFIAVSEPWDEPEIGPHVRMRREL